MSESETLEVEQLESDDDERVFSCELGKFRGAIVRRSGTREAAYTFVVVPSCPPCYAP